MPIATIRPADLQNLLDQGKNIELLDVRTPVEFREVHASAAKNVPLDKVVPENVMSRRDCDASEPLYIICQSGSRANQACQKFLSAGYENVVNVEGGTLAWDSAGLEVVRGKKTISLERQVRIAAGFLVLLGAVLAHLVNPYFIGLSAFVGAGLIFAGVTNTCGMGMVLARMPWNQVPQEGSSCQI